MVFSPKFELSLEWQDGRLQFMNMEKEENSNILTLEQMKEIWLPQLILVNTKQNKIAMFDNPSSHGSINIGKLKIFSVFHWLLLPIVYNL